MKAIITLITLSAASLLQAHPGAPGHTHPENTGQEEWPFPEFSWPMLIAIIALVAVASKRVWKKS